MSLKLVKDTYKPKVLLEQLNDLLKAASEAERSYCKARSTEKQDKRIEFKEKQATFDKMLKEIKYQYLRKTETNLDSMVGMSGCENVEEIGRNWAKN